MIDPNRVTEMFMDCLFHDEEVINGKPIMDPIYAVGILTNVGFHPERVKNHTQEINGMLNQLPKTFHEGTGDGMTFLNMCEDAQGEQWTGMHQVMEKLVLLGMAIGRVAFTLPREMWSALPGNMPYITIKKLIA